MSATLPSPVLQLGPEFCVDPARALEREWLETNGLGGYAGSTVAGANTRSGHGLLVAALEPPRPPMVLISKLEEGVAVGAGWWELGTNVYRGALHPDGFRRLTEFHVDVFPCFTYRAEPFELRKTVIAPWGENATLVRYDVLRADGPFELVVRPLVAARDIGATTSENCDLDSRYAVIENRAVFEPYRGVPPFQIAWVGAPYARIEPTGHWYRAFEYRAEDPAVLEDLFNPCRIVLPANAGDTVWLLLSERLAPVHQETVAGLHDLERFRRRNLRFAGGREAQSALERWLLRAADQFLVRAPRSPLTAAPALRVLAGYPTVERERDSLIALPGLLLATGRAPEALQLLRAFGDRWRTASEAAPDAPLWFIHAAERYLRHSGDLENLRRELWPAMRDVLDSFGGKGSPSIDCDGLLALGNPPSKRVDIQALWYHALSVGTFLAQTFDGSRAARGLARLARDCRNSFTRAFWNHEAKCLHDSVGGAEPDPTLHPRQLLAVALPNSMLARREQQLVVRRVEAELLDPLGLRAGGGIEPAWLGAFLSAYRQAFGRSPSTSRRLTALLADFWREVEELGIGTLPERFTLDRRVSGLPVSALSVAEIVRAYCEAVRPKR